MLFSTAQAVMASLVKAHGDGSLEDRLAFYAKPKLLVVDLCGAVGYVELECSASPSCGEHVVQLHITGG